MKSKRPLIYSYVSLLIIVIAVFKMAPESPQSSNSQVKSEDENTVVESHIKKDSREVASEEEPQNTSKVQSFVKKIDPTADWQINHIEDRPHLITGGKIPLSQYNNSALEFAEAFLKQLDYQVGTLSEVEQNIQDTPYMKVASFPQVYSGYEVDGGFFKLSISKKDDNIYVINNEIQKIKNVEDQNRVTIDELLSQLRSQDSKGTFAAVQQQPVLKYIQAKDAHVLCYKILYEVKSGKVKRSFNFYSALNSELLYSQNLIMR